MATITGYTQAGADAKHGGTEDIAADHGAVMDGVTDDTAAVQAAFDACAATGGVVTAPAGRVLISSTILVTGQNPTFVGAGTGQRDGATQNGTGTRLNRHRLRWGRRDRRCGGQRHRPRRRPHLRRQLLPVHHRRAQQNNSAAGAIDGLVLGRNRCLRRETSTSTG